MSFNGKVAWITGASSGIGEALARELATRGASIILSGRRKAELERVASSLSSQALVLPFEATDYDALPQITEQAWAWRDGISLLVNNAGISQRSLAIDTDIAVYRQLMEIDFFAPVHLTRLVLPRMIERHEGQIAIVSSVAGKVGVPLRTGYCAAKHACLGYFDALRAEIDTAYGIGLSVITPGSVQTAIATNALRADGSKRGRSDANIDGGMPAGDAARIIADGLENGVREIPVATGGELAALHLRTQDPETLFGRLAQEGARLAALRESHGADFDPEPGVVQSASTDTHDF